MQAFYLAELEILDLYADLAASVASEEVQALFTGYEEDTVKLIHRLERIFETREEPPHADGSPVMEGILAKKDTLVSAPSSDDCRDLDVLSTGLMVIVERRRTEPVLDFGTIILSQQSFELLISKSYLTNSAATKSPESWGGSSTSFLRGSN